MMERRTENARLPSLGVIALGITALAGCGNRTSSSDNVGLTSSSVSPVEDGSISVLLRDDGSGPYHATPVPIVTLDESPGPLAAKPAGTPTEPVDPNEEVLKEVEALPQNETVELTVTLQDPPADWQSFAGMREDDFARSEFIDNRQVLLDEAQRPLLEWLSAQGYKGIGLWLVNQVEVTVPARLVRLIYQRPDVLGISTSAKIVPGAEWDGYHSLDGTLLSQLQAVSVDGRSGNRTSGSSRIRIGIMEAAMLNRDHVGWAHWLNGPTRIVSVKNCGSYPCASLSTTGGSDTEDPHGTLVTWIATGSIQEGQDTLVPGTNTIEQRRRSGHLRESNIYFYTGPGSLSIRRAIDQAVLDGVDVLNLSLQSGTQCSSTYNASGINEALAAATNAGVLVAACGGNTDLTGCRAWYPGVRTETISVNGLDSSNTADPYSSLGMLGNAARGGMSIRTFDGFYSTTSVIDLTAPGALRYRFWHPSGTTSYWPYGASGCSVATPVVTAAAGALRNAFHDVGWSTTSAKALMVNMLLLGDNWDADLGTNRRVGVSNLSGAGRLRMHMPNALTAPAGWGWRSETIYNHQWKTWSVGSSDPESASVTQWKWAALWFEPDLQNVADIDFYVYDLCPAGGGGAQLIASDTSHDLRMRMNLLQSEISGRCLQMYAYGYSVPSGGREFWSADYFHGGDPYYH